MKNSSTLLKNYINGEFIGSSKTFANVSPVNGTIISQVCEADESSIDLAVQAAKAAQEGPWSKMSVAERASMLRKVADGIEKHFDAFVAAEVADTGRPVSQAKSLDIARGMENFRSFAQMMEQSGNDFFEMRAPNGDDIFNYVVRKPHGVVAIISPWNLPMLSLTWKVAPALACGNSVIVKPSEESPSSATLLAEVMHEVGMPAGVFNLVHGFGANSAGEFLTRHPGVDAITFTGASATGSGIMKAAAQGMRDVSFELGGKNAAVVFEDCDFDKAVAGVVRSSFTNTGQVCLCSERVYVQRSIFDKFVAALKEKTEQIKIGYPDEENVGMGALISKKHREKVLAYYDLAVQEGAVVVTGGGIPIFNDERDDGAYIQPTIWTGLSDHARCMQEEIFGPVCHIAPFDTASEVAKRVNDTQYGLAATVWTTNLKHAHQFTKQLHVGLVWVNNWFVRDLRTPFGGPKLSGIGREGGRYSLDFYSEISTIYINP